ncbi:maleylpyruvate isomerase family mycothiol-dependent enzyme [Streptomyces sp. NPDC055025]
MRAAEHPRARVSAADDIGGTSAARGSLPERSLRWAAEGTGLFLAAMDGLGDDGLGLPTALPGWTRRHLLAHVAANAEALGRLVSWARTGSPCPMYASPEQRADEIERGSHLSADELRAWVLSAARALEAAFATMPESAWAAQVVTARGRTVPAAEVPWLRAREVAVHAVDLDAGMDFDDLPTGFCRALTDDVVRSRATRLEGPALRLTATDIRASWTVMGEDEPIRVTAPVARLAAWLTGRERQTGLPVLPAWL